MEEAWEMRPDWKVCRAVQVLGFARLRLAITAPVVGEMVKVESPAVTLETPVTRQVALMAKHPAARLIPFANDEDAMDEVTLRRFVWIPPAKVLVADPDWLNAPVAPK